MEVNIGAGGGGGPEQGLEEAAVMPAREEMGKHFGPMGTWAVDGHFGSLPYTTSPMGKMGLLQIILLISCVEWQSCYLSITHQQQNVLEWSSCRIFLHKICNILVMDPDSKR